ncbi:MAG: hypothetical protein ACI8P3_000676 [Saprospiraceae bacterium]
MLISPAINAGDNSLVVETLDFTNINARIIDGTVDLGALEYVVIVSVKAIDHTNEIQIAPNPFSSQVQITFSGSLLQPEALKEILIFNTAGQLIYQKPITQQQTIDLNLSHLPAGLYILEIIGEDARYQQRMLNPQHTLNGALSNTWKAPFKFRFNIRLSLYFDYAVVSPSFTILANIL